MKRTTEFNFYDLLSALKSNDVYGKMGIVVVYLDVMHDDVNIANILG